MTDITLLLVAVFVAFFSLVLGLSFWLTRNKTLDRRLHQIQDENVLIGHTGRGAKNWQLRLAGWASSFVQLSAPMLGDNASTLRLRFYNAGLRKVYWPALFFVGKLALALLLPLMLMLAGGLTGSSVISRAALVVMVLTAAAGYYIPNWLLAVLVHARQRKIEEAMPDAIDLMILCVEAGLSIDAAMQRTSDDLSLRSKELADELTLMTLELQVGPSREAAMQNLALRTGVESVSTFVTILLQSEHFGTNVAESLRVLSETMRDTRRMRAEETAAKIPLKLLFPMIMLIFPALFVVLLGPAAISIYRTLLPTLGIIH